MGALELDPASKEISFSLQPFMQCTILQKKEYLSLQALILDDTCRDATGALWAATQPLRCTSSFSNWRLYIWTYACLHILSYVCLYYSFATVLMTISVCFWLMLILYLCCHAKTYVFIHYILISLLSCK